MVITRHEWEEQRDDLIADELVDATVVVEDCLGGDRVEAVDQGSELGRRQALSESRRATDVGE